MEHSDRACDWPLGLILSTGKKTQVTNGQMLSHQKFGSPNEKTLFKIPIFISNLSGVH